MCCDLDVETTDDGLLGFFQAGWLTEVKLEAVDVWMEDDGEAPDVKAVASSEVVLLSLCFMEALEKSVALSTCQHPWRPVSALHPGQMCLLQLGLLWHHLQPHQAVQEDQY